MTEIWKDIPGYEGRYQASTEGRLKSLNYKKTGKEKILKPGNNKGYQVINICNGTIVKTHLIHRIICFTFIGTSNKEINHKNGIKIDNRLENLEYCTRSENLLHAYKTGLRKTQTYGKTGLKKIQQVDKNGDFIKNWNSAYEASRELGINRGNICNCCNGKLKSAGNFIWKYL